MEFSQQKRDKPYNYILKTIEELKNINGRLIVEIGFNRRPLTHPITQIMTCCNDGHSSIMWASTGLEFYTIDISKDAYNITKNEMEKRGYSNATVLNGDGIKFLKEFSKVIDLLYLDAWDVGVDGYAESHLEAYKTSKDKLADKHLILIDDTDADFVDGKLEFIDGFKAGKGRLLIPYLLENGYTVILEGRQTLLKNYE